MLRSIVFASSTGAETTLDDIATLATENATNEGYWCRHELLHLSFKNCCYECTLREFIDLHFTCKFVPCFVGNGLPRV